MEGNPMPTIFSIVYHPKDRDYDNRDSDYIRIPLETAHLIADHGIEGDQKAGHNPERNLNLLSRQWLAAAAEKGYRAQPGEFGEQIIVDGIPMEELEAGARLRLGQQAVIEVSKLRNGCERLEAAQGRKVKGVMGPLGAMARVVTGGAIKVGDAVVVLEPAPAESGD